MKFSANKFFDGSIDAFSLSASAHEMGTDQAGVITWRNSLVAAEDNAPVFPSEEHKEAFKRFVRSSGCWADEEIAAWSDEELGALLLQWIAGDIRESPLDDACPSDPEGWDQVWEEYDEWASLGQASGRLWRDENGDVWWSCDE